MLSGTPAAIARSHFLPQIGACCASTRLILDMPFMTSIYGPQNHDAIECNAHTHTHTSMHISFMFMAVHIFTCICLFARLLQVFTHACTKCVPLCIRVACDGWHSHNWGSSQQHPSFNDSMAASNRSTNQRCLHYVSICSRLRALSREAPFKSWRLPWNIRDKILKFVLYVLVHCYSVFKIVRS